MQQQLDLNNASVHRRGPEPWPRVVNGDTLLGTIVKTILQYVSMTREQAVVIALWVMFAHCHHAFRISPILALVSPTKRCGKTTVLSILGFMVPRALQAARITPAAIYRAVDADRPTILIDEADSFLPGRQDLRGILNSGHMQSSASVVLMMNGKARRFSTWTPKVVALIGSLPDTLEDRSIVVGLQRKSQREKLCQITTEAERNFLKLSQKAARWARDNEAFLVDADPEMPDTLHDRAADNWRPLLAIADRAGPKWSRSARKAAVELAGIDPTQTMHVGELLLHDIRGLLNGAEKNAKLPSSKIVDALAAMEDRPWPGITRGRALTAPKLAQLLKPFGITPKLLRIGSEVCRGYIASDFEDAFGRYLSG